jgi:hypothetical protein
MTTNFSTKLMAAMAAVTVTASLIVSSFANPHATTVMGLLA